ncbi:SUMF1/EgtB/PvdO family nonheme iron enzyme [Mucilaginibacter daejeonensis]|uniref:type IX secretion system lipoprotein PorK/GldK n=1 Tax=Mucilaginibacter daejeonensis TaxID=398049 RepID=UPI001D17A6FB|nr:SUMF1/EgtB/PvdO family nonheme iron enzyme [Mucilaginibacter daejeonensis]UEG52641.1 SUMF1/EgtB/PvdO family nonheme iron enzyme [Mucilaginibacter daejeonensis]
MKFTQVAITLSAILAITACKSKRLADIDNIGKSRTTLQSLTPLAPHGMVFVPAGSIVEKDVVKDTLMAQDTAAKTVTVSAFFMDQTEVTNKQYRMFVDWVADSVAITDYLKDEKYFQKTKKAATTTRKGKGKNATTVEVPTFADTTKMIDWSKADGRTPLWQSQDPTIKGALFGKLYTMENGRPTLIRNAVVYRFDRRSVDRNGASRYITDTVAVPPNTKVWSTDFPNSQMEVMDNNYFTNRGYDEHPVVGVTWKQARAYANWRSKMIYATAGERSLVKTYNLQYNLPSEAQWEYAASMDTKPEDMSKLATVNLKDKKTKKNVDMLAVNFKQQEGDYRKDGGTFTMHVKSYAPNSVGLYNMMGNVSEWTLDAFSPSYKQLVHDLNPVLLYDADDSEAEAMRRKVIRGGSWKDNATLLTPSTRNYEIQNVAHSYIGFRCVMPAPDIVLEQTKTRKFANK